MNNTKTNAIGLQKQDYKGSPTTLCAGCGHNSISSQIITASFELGIQPEQLVKISGIGCSSKSPAYFMNRSFAFNSVHGRMPSVVSGAILANRNLIAVGISGDGDSGSIGIGQFKHSMRRNVPMVYIVENNGVYGLTKGQFSVTADKDQNLKYYGHNDLPPLDLCMEAIIADCGFVARSFAGDAKQVRPLLKAALSYNGTALLDIISPCVTFNDSKESTKSYDWVKENKDPLHDITYIPLQDEITTDYDPGETTMVTLHDGSQIILKKLDESYDPTNKMDAITALYTANNEASLLTGLIYYNPNKNSLIESENLVKEPLSHLPEEELRPSADSLRQIVSDL